MKKTKEWLADVKLKKISKALEEVQKKLAQMMRMVRK